VVYWLVQPRSADPFCMSRLLGIPAMRSAAALLLCAVRQPRFTLLQYVRLVVRTFERVLNMWVKLDDGFASHPKIAQLSDKEFRVWVRLLCYCARYKSVNGEIGSARNEVIGVTEAFLKKAGEVGLLDDVDGQLCVHDWQDYLPARALKNDRQKRWRDGRVDGDVDAGVDGRVDASVDGDVDGTHAGVRAGGSRPVQSEDQNPIAESPPATRQKRAVKKKENPPDHDFVINILTALFGEPTNDGEWGRRHREAKHIHQSLIAFSPDKSLWHEETRRRANILRERWGSRDMVHPKSLGEHWSKCDPVPVERPAWFSTVQRSELLPLLDEFVDVLGEPPSWWTDVDGDDPSNPYYPLSWVRQQLDIRRDRRAA